MEDSSNNQEPEKKFKKSGKDKKNKEKRPDPEIGTIGSILDPEIIKAMYKVAYAPRKKVNNFFNKQE